MFTGIVEHLGSIERLERSPHGGRLTIHAPELAPGLAIAGSIAVNGCCLTIVEKTDEAFSADLSLETLCRTAFSEMKAGTVVNLERPLTAGKEFGGHFVQGHVDGVGRVARLRPEGGKSGEKDGGNWWLAVRVPEEIGRYVALKGSLAVDGISLTVAGWSDGIVDLAIIPFTYAHTNIRGLTVGDPVNLECDILAKYIERLMECKGDSRTAPGGRVTIHRLVEEGF